MDELFTVSPGIGLGYFQIMDNKKEKPFSCNAVFKNVVLDIDNEDNVIGVEFLDFKKSSKLYDFLINSCSSNFVKVYDE